MSSGADDKFSVPDAVAPAPDENAVKAAELRVRELEARKALAATATPWWRRADPLVLAILAGALSLLGNVVEERTKAKDDLALEQAKARYSLVLQAMATNDVTSAKRNIHFFIDAGLLADDDCRIRDAIDQDQPVLPSLSGVAPAVPAGLHSAPEIATLYDFPPGLDGRGQTIGILEFGGAVVQEDMAAYFKLLSLPVPDVTPVLVDGAVQKSDINIDAQVMVDLEIIGAIAPRAHLRVYFAPFSAQGFADAINQAASDHVSILSNGWGKAESAWKDDEIQAVNSALGSAARQGVTILAAAGDTGVTDGVKDGKKHVDFPASSPWVLAVGGTALKSDSGHIVSETVWKDETFEAATGGGVSDKFALPDWQTAVTTPKREDGQTGRAIPDVAASASPELGVTIILHGRKGALGGTSASVPLMAGLIALVNQGVGYNVGYLNPKLYQGMGPAGVFRAITSGDNSVGNVKGYSAGPGWSAVAGWGSPDGVKLMNWLRDHPDLNRAASAASVPCRVGVK